ncbi:hypothetical protein SAMN05216332_10320 [Nitrosospira briensis]|nr:hypothetical protein SAMN05216332_10320 [Nitrosospira briensis]
MIMPSLSLLFSLCPTDPLSLARYGMPAKRPEEIRFEPATSRYLHTALIDILSNPMSTGRKITE